MQRSHLRLAISGSFLGLIVLILVPAVSKAAVVNLSASAASVRLGEKVLVIFNVDSPGASVYTVKINAAFTPTILHFFAWESDSDWVPLRQKGYDSVDAARGMLVRTAGYPGGFSGKSRFGVATFVAAEVGQAMVIVNPGSFAYNETGKNIYSGGNSLAINVLPAGSGSGSPVQGQNGKVEQPTLFDVSAQGLSSQNFSIVPYVVGIAVFGIICGVVLIVFVERSRRRKMYEKSRSKNKL